MKLFELTFYDHGVCCVERHWGFTRVQAQGQIIHRLKRQVKFESVVEVADNSEQKTNQGKTV